MKTFAIFYEAKRALGVSAKVKKLPKGVERLPDGTYKKTRDRLTMYALDPQMTKLHRIDGPAIIEPGIEEWWLNGRRHRIGGPAVIAHGYGRETVYEKWWVEGVQFTEEDYNNLMKKLSTLTDDSDKEATIAAATMFD